jgi:copper resistance protein D
VAAILAGIGWLILETAAMASVATPSEVVQALPLVALQTHYGKVMLARLGLLLIATVFFRPDSTSRISIILLLTAAALSLQGFIGHAGAMGGERGAALTAFESLHLLAAGLWLGALMPLWLSLGRLPAASAQVVCMRFSPIGLGCVLVIAGTGLAQGLVLIGSPSALVDTDYGRIALVKISLFFVALALAALNRLWLTDRLTQANTPRLMQGSVASEAVVGLVIIIAAAFLASSMPPMHSGEM